jgi:uncharacterized protein involved in outer membrane biogenesis
MTLRRGIAWFFVVFGVLLLALASYLAFVDLGRHKGRIQDLVTQLTGREFVIEGELKFELFPSVSLVAENVRIAHADWGSKQPMVQAGRLSTNVGFWSLIFGRPVDVRAFELRDATLLLERGGEDEVNWIFRKPAPIEPAPIEPAPAARNPAADEPEEPAPAASPLPLVIEEAKLRDVRVIYRVRGKRDRIVHVDNLTIAPGQSVEGAAPLLSLEGRGQLNEFPISVDGQAGPLQSLLQGRDIRLDLEGSVGRLALDVKGSIGRLVPFDGASLKIRATGSDVDAMLARLELPAIATGKLRIDAVIEDSGELTKLDLDVSAGDLGAKAKGTLAGLQLRGADLQFQATVADAARLASVFGIHGVPAAPLTVGGRVKPLRREIRFENLSAQLAGISAQLHGKLRRNREPRADVKFELAVENLSELRADLPQRRFSASGHFTGGNEKLEITGLVAALDDNQVSGRLATTRGTPRRIEADLSSPRVDLTPWFPTQTRPAAAASPGATSKKEPRKQARDEPGDRFVFSDDPLPIHELKGTEAKIRLAVTELVLGGKSLRDIESTAEVDRAHVTLTARARGSLEGAMQGAITFEPVGDDSAKFNLRLGLENVRAGLDMKEMQPADVPPLSVEIELVTHGNSARQMAANANGYVLLTQGAGKTKAEFLDAFGGNVFAELRSRLNPFRKDDPFTKLECTVLRADIVDGAVTVTPMLLQTQKVTVVAQGKVDLHTEKLTLDFDTRPRKGIGVSPGMFTNPFIRVEGTLKEPRLAMGAKGVTSGAVAAMTGGLSVVAGGFIDRLKGEANMCGKALESARKPKVAS